MAVMAHLDLKQELRGIIASLHTPFTEKNTIDRDSLIRLVEHCANSGCRGVLVTAVAGEVETLTAGEREQLLRYTVDAAGDRLRIVAGISAATLDDSVGHARIASKLSIPLLMWQPPAGLNEDQLRTGLRRIAAQGDHQIMLQDLDWTGPGIDPDVIARLADAVPALTAIKIETAPAGPKYSAVSKCTGGSLHLSGGWAVMQMLDGLARGLDAFIPSGLLAIQVRIFAAWERGDVEEARRLFELILPVMVFTNQHIDISRKFWKYVRVRQNIFTTLNCRQSAEFDPIQQSEASRLCDRVLALESAAANI